MMKDDEKFDEKFNAIRDLLIENNRILKEGEIELRKLLWLHHGCPILALYGDDGEMQCSACLIDFKRESVASIKQKFESIARQKLNNFEEMKG